MPGGYACQDTGDAQQAQRLAQVAETGAAVVAAGHAASPALLLVNTGIAAIGTLVALSGLRSQRGLTGSTVAPEVPGFTELPKFAEDSRAVTRSAR